MHNAMPVCGANGRKQKLQRSYKPDIRIQFELRTTWAADKISLKKAIKCEHLMETSVDILRQGKTCTKIGTINCCVILQET